MSQQNHHGVSSFGGGGVSGGGGGGGGSSSGGIPINNSVHNEMYENLPQPHHRKHHHHHHGHHHQQQQQQQSHHHHHHHSHSQKSNNFVIINKSHIIADDIVNNIDDRNDDELLQLQQSNTDGINGNGSNGSDVGGGGGGVTNQKKNNLSKELLYATPLRKSDRYKIKYKYNNVDGGGNATPASASAATNSNILNNIQSSSDKINNQHYLQQSADKNGQSMNEYHRNNGETISTDLEERRILNFLKDTSQLHKRMEMHKDFPNSNFSCLAREEHFANLVQQNVITTTVTETPIASTSSACKTSTDYVNNNKKKMNAGAGAAVGKSGSTIANVESDDVIEADRNQSNLEHLMDKKLSPDKEVTDLIELNDKCNKTNNLQNMQQSHGQPNNGLRPHKHQQLINININREWVLQKIAMCLEQRCNNIKKSMPLMSNAILNCSEMNAAKPPKDLPLLHNNNNINRITSNICSSSYSGCMILGSNGSGKTSICHSILGGQSGTRGILNRKLLSCYFINSQNPECHSLSIFIRNLILQILSHSSYIIKDENTTNNNGISNSNNNNINNNINDIDQNNLETGKSSNTEQEDDDNNKESFSITSKEKNNLDEKIKSICNDENFEEEMLIAELRLNEKINEFCEKTTTKLNNEKAQMILKLIGRQHSEPTSTTSSNIHLNDRGLTSSTSSPTAATTTTTTMITTINANNTTTNNKNPYTTHPPLNQKVTIKSVTTTIETRLILDDGNNSDNSNNNQNNNSNSNNNNDDDDTSNSNNNSSISNDNSYNQNFTRNKNRSKTKISKIPIKVCNKSTLKGANTNAVDNPQHHHLQQQESIDEIKDQHDLDNTNNNNNNNDDYVDDSGGGAAQDKLKINAEPLKNNNNIDDLTKIETNKIQENIITKQNSLDDNNLNITESSSSTINNHQSNELIEKQHKQQQQQEPEQIDEVSATESVIITAAPLPLPKLKSCRTEIADEYYDMLINNPDIFEYLYPDNIEKNPDECFKKAILFPLLEITPPKSALLLLIDSIDEKYINEGNLISTLKGRNNSQGAAGLQNGGGGGGPGSDPTLSAATASSSSAAINNKSHNIAELLANHIHLFPKWLFIVCTAKKQNKHIVKMFNGFKKITLDDLRKSHVVKDVQEYIINRLNTDFKGTINLTKEIIESLNQLYIKSNGCILYLQKVLDCIKENFFSFREIKLIPCTLNGLYLYICQKSFNKKQYTKIQPILNILLACNDFVDKNFIMNCLRTHNYTIDANEFEKRLDYMKNILVYKTGNGDDHHDDDGDDELADGSDGNNVYENENGNIVGAHQIDEHKNLKNSMTGTRIGGGEKIKIFHNSFCDWLVDVKFSTTKFLCNVNEGHIMIAMYYTLISEQLCPNQVRHYLYNLIKSQEYSSKRKLWLELDLILLQSRTNLNDCFYTNLLNCCSKCELEYKMDLNVQPKIRLIVEKFFQNELSDEFAIFLCDFFKPNLPTDTKVLKLLIDTCINNADCKLSLDDYSPQSSPILTGEEDKCDKNIDTELAELLISSERKCHQESLKSQQKHNQQQQQPQETEQPQQPQQEQICGGALVGTSGTSGTEGYILTITEDNNPKLCYRLNDSRVTYNYVIGKGKALIHILSNDGNHLLLERALKACKETIDLEIEDASGQTALIIAARNGHVEIVRLLLTLKQTECLSHLREIDVNHADRDGWTPLRSASWGGHTEIVKLLIKHEKCVIDLADKEERTALRAAAWSGHEDILKILIEAGANVNSVDKQGRTSLIAASYMGHYEIVEILLENGANVNHLDIDGRSALCVAGLCGTSGSSKVISCLLDHGAKTDQLDNDGMSPLLVSSFEGNTEVCELLLENGADLDLADFMGRTPLWAACTAGQANVVKLLLFWGCGIDCMDSEGRTVLSIAAAQGNLETVRQLLDRGLDETHRDNAGWTPLHYAAFEGYADICVQLIESGAKIDECDNEGKIALHLAAQEGRDKVIEAILTVHGSCIDQRAHDGKTAFRLACVEGHLDCINTLLKYGCDVNLKDADSRTTLYVLALENKRKVVEYLLQESNINVNTPDSEGRTALHVASWQGHTEMVKLLLKGHADVNAMDLDCRTPLHSCAWQGNDEIMAILLFFGAIPDHACKQGATALGISAQEGHEKCVSLLLEYGANPFKSDHCGRTPIKLAAKSNRSDIIEIIENYAQSNVNFEGKHRVGGGAGETAGSSVNSVQHIQKSPDKPLLLCTVSPNQQSNNQNLLMPIGNPANINATNSTHSSNFYENTMQSDTGSFQKRKSVISSQSTGSSNNETPLSFTQQLQRHSRHNSRHGHGGGGGGVNLSNSINLKYPKGSQKHSQILANVDEYEPNISPHILINDADLSDAGCMSPLYATPPHSPSSDISSPGQHPPNFEDIGAHHNIMGKSHNNHNHSTQKLKSDHFTRDTHMRIILGNIKENNQSSSKSSKRSGIATNPAIRMIRNRFDLAAQLIRRTNNILSSSNNNHNNSNSQDSSSIGIKSSTFQWRKESQM